MFGIKGRDTFNRPVSSRVQIATMIKDKWLRYFPYFLAFAILAVGVYVSYLWFIFVYTKELTHQEEEAYINQKKQEVIFRQKKFDDLKTVIESRGEKFHQERRQYEDIFYHTGG